MNTVYGLPAMSTLPSLESLLNGLKTPAAINIVTAAYQLTEARVIAGEITPDAACDTLVDELVRVLTK